MVDSPSVEPDAARAATDSPWFWAMLFSCAALIGLVVIAPKFTVRHGNVQRQDEGRWEVWRRHGERTSGDGNAEFTDEYVNVREQMPTFSLSSHTGLWLLLLLLVGLVVFTTFAWRRDVWRERLRAVQRIEDMPEITGGDTPPDVAHIEPKSGGRDDGVAV